MLRAAPNSTTEHAEIQWRGAGGGYKTVTSVTTSDPNGFFTADVKFPGVRSGADRVDGGQRSQAVQPGGGRQTDLTAITATPTAASR